MQLNNAEINVVRFGDSGPRILLLHGWGGKIESWLPLIRDLKSTTQLIAVDFPGHGQSAEPPTPWNVTDYMDQIVALIRTENLAPVSIVAHSFGGRVALLLASTYPELVNRMVLTGCAGLIPKHSFKYYLRTYTYKFLKAVYNCKLTSTLLGAKAEQLRAGLQKKYGSSDYRSLSETMRGTFVKVVNQDLRPCLPRIRASTLLFWGETDTATPLWMGQTMEKEIPDAGLVVMPGCGHFAYLDRYPDFLSVVQRFLCQ